MSGKITAIAAMILLLAAGGAVFICGGTDLLGTSDSNSVSVSDEGKTSQSDDDDNLDDDSSTWSGTDVIVDDASGITLTYVSGTEDCYRITQNGSTGEYTITFSGLTEDTVYLISGTLTGCIRVDADGYDFKLGLNGVSITSSNSPPVVCTAGDNFIMAAMEGTVNTITDNRTEKTDSDAICSCIYSVCDLKLQGNAVFLHILQQFFALGAAQIAGI